MPDMAYLMELFDPFQYDEDYMFAIIQEANQSGSVGPKAIRKHVTIR